MLKKICIQKLLQSTAEKSMKRIKSFLNTPPRFFIQDNLAKRAEQLAKRCFHSSSTGKNLERKFARVYSVYNQRWFLYCGVNAYLTG